MQGIASIQGIANIQGKTNETAEDYVNVLKIINYVNLLHIPLMIFTNGAVLVIIYQIKRLHTPYNYIVFALATADPMHMISIVISLLDDYGDGTFLRRSFFGCLLYWVVHPIPGQLSLNMILLLSIDRYIGVCFPVWYRNHVTNSCIITLAVGMVLPEIVFACAVANVMNCYDHHVNIICGFDSMPSFYLMYYKIKVPSIILTVLILTALTFCAAVKHIKRKRKMTRNIAKPRSQSIFIRSREYLSERRAQSEEIRPIRITISLVLLFVIFWLPVMLAGFWFSEEENSEGETGFKLLVYRILVIWQGFNFSVNAFVYALSRHDFKVGFKFIFTNKPCKWNKLNRYIARLEHLKQILDNKNRVKNVKFVITNKPSLTQFQTDTIQDYEKTKCGIEEKKMNEMLVVDSRSAIAWVRRKCSTMGPTEHLAHMSIRAHKRSVSSSWRGTSTTESFGSRVLKVADLSLDTS